VRAAASDGASPCIQILDRRNYNTTWNQRAKHFPQPLGSVSVNVNIQQAYDPMSTPAMVTSEHTSPAQPQIPSSMYQFDAEGRPTQMAFANNPQAASTYRHRPNGKPQIDPAQDSTIGIIAAREEDCVADLMQAFFDVTGILDAPTFTAIPYCTRGHRDAFPDMDVEAACREIWAQLLRQCRHGFSGFPSQDRLGRTQQGESKRTFQVEDANGNCQTRFLNVVSTLKSWKSVCQEVMYSDAKIKNLVNAPATISYDKKTQARANKTKAETNKKRKAAQEQLDAQTAPGTQLDPNVAPPSRKSKGNTNFSQPTPTQRLTDTVSKPRSKRPRTGQDLDGQHGLPVAKNDIGSDQLRPVENPDGMRNEEVQMQHDDTGSIGQDTSNIANESLQIGAVPSNQPSISSASTVPSTAHYAAAPPLCSGTTYAFESANNDTEFEDVARFLFDEDPTAESSTLNNISHDRGCDGTDTAHDVTHTGAFNDDLSLYPAFDFRLLDPDFPMSVPALPGDDEPAVGGHRSNVTHPTLDGNDEVSPPAQPSMVDASVDPLAVPSTTGPMSGVFIPPGMSTSTATSSSQASGMESTPAQPAPPALAQATPPVVVSNGQPAIPPNNGPRGSKRGRNEDEKEREQEQRSPRRRRRDSYHVHH
jgi:hypothetical protein